MENDYLKSKVNLFSFKNIHQLCNKKLNSLIKILTNMNKSGNETFVKENIFKDDQNIIPRISLLNVNIHKLV